MKYREISIILNLMDSLSRETGQMQGSGWHAVPWEVI